jgi:hypothetical protein
MVSSQNDEDLYVLILWIVKLQGNLYPQLWLHHKMTDEDLRFCYSLDGKCGIYQ